MTKQHNDKEALYAKIVGFFDQRVLASYRSEPDKYVIETDHFNGHLWRVYDNEGIS
jgi:hypothetical protein